jgi:hypothetical protein
MPVAKRIGKFYFFSAIQDFKNALRNGKTENSDANQQ